LVNVRRPDSIQALPQNPLNPYVMNVMQLLTDMNEKSTGISALSTGMNKDAISTQNSSALIDNMMKASGQRAKIAARNFAYGFFVSLMIEVVRLGILHDKQRVIDVAGSPLQVDPQSWTERKTCTVSMHLGYGEKDKLASSLENAYEKMSKDTSISQIFGLPQKYEMLSDAMKAARFPGASKYLLTPDKAGPPPGPDPIKMGELQVKQQLANAANTQAQAANDKNQKLLAIDSERINVDKAKLKLTSMDHDRTNNRHDLETAAKIDIGQREMVMLEKAPPAAEKAIVAPRN
jgi:stress response protein YsnF